VNLIDPPYKVDNHEKILIPVGTAIIIVAAVKYALVINMDSPKRGVHPPKLNYFII